MFSDSHSRMKKCEKYPPTLSVLQGGPFLLLGNWSSDFFKQSLIDHETVNQDDYFTVSQFYMQTPWLVLI